jgi:hypothetical protein
MSHPLDAEHLAQPAQDAARVTVEIIGSPSELLTAAQKARAAAQKVPTAMLRTQAMQAAETIKRSGMPMLDIAGTKHRWATERLSERRRLGEFQAGSGQGIPRARQACAGGRRRPGARRVVRSSSGASGSDSEGESEPARGRRSTADLLVGHRTRLLSESVNRIGGAV